MAPKTIKKSITDALEDLSSEDLEKFRFHLLDRRDKPTVKRNQVEGKSFLVVADVLVRTFTEPKALEVTLETLRGIQCHEAACNLEEETSAQASKPDSSEKEASAQASKPDASGKEASAQASEPDSSGKEASAQASEPDSSDKEEASAQASEPDSINKSRTRICLDNGDPTFPKTLTGELDTKPSQEALAYGAIKTSQPVKDPKVVEAEAKALVLSEGGNPIIDRLVLSRFTIQFGKYKSKHFKWLLENDVGYVAYLVASHLKEVQSKAHQNSPDPLIANKDSLTRYTRFYPEVRREITIQCANELKGTQRVGFGTHRSMTLCNLYTDPKTVSYVDYLRGMASTCEPGSKMQLAVGYILRRDKSKAPASTANRPTTSGPPQAASRRPIKRKRAQGTRAQPSTAKGSKRRKVDSGWKSTSRVPPY